MKEQKKSSQDLRSCRDWQERNIKKTHGNKG